MKKPRVSKNISLTIYERVDLGVRLRPDRLSQFVQPENRIVLRDLLLFL
jgi:hypothetical protein